MEKDIEKLLDGVKIPSDEEVEAAGMRFDRRIRRLRMRRRVIRVTGSVAAVLCCGFVFAFLWMNRGTKENIDKYGMYLTINDDKSITITPCGSLQVEMIGGAEDNYYEVDKKGRQIFYLHYKYFDTNVTVTDDKNTWTEDCWITMEEKGIRSL